MTNKRHATFPVRRETAYEGTWNASDLQGVKDAAEYCGVRAESLAGWVASGHAPHYFIDGRGPYFKRSLIRRWVNENMVQVIKGMAAPKAVDILRPCDGQDRAGVPLAIATIPSLCVLGIQGHASGVYFLCQDGEVVYVGQAVSVICRIATHLYEGVKKFDLGAVYFMPTPRADLDVVENWFIELLKPKYNFNSKGTGFGEQRFGKRRPQLRDPNSVSA